jgi:hypothetical protein
MTVRVTTGEPCANFSGTAIVVAPDTNESQRRFSQHFLSASTPASQCSAGLIGTLVVTPGPNTGTILVAGRVQANGVAQDPSACDDPANAPSCIIARRSFSFVSHAALTLPIDLDPACLGRDCTPGTTGFKGQCVSDAVQCSGDACGLAGEVDVGQGSGTDASTSDGAYDAEIDALASIDADVLDAMPLDDGAITDAAGGDGATLDAAAFPSCSMTVAGPMGQYLGYCTIGGSAGVEQPCPAGGNCCWCQCMSGHGIAICTIGASMNSCSGACQTSVPQSQ